MRGPQQMWFICWGARLARNEREARKPKRRESRCRKDFAKRRCGRDARGPSEELEPFPKLEQFRSFSEHLILWPTPSSACWKTYREISLSTRDTKHNMRYYLQSCIALDEESSLI